MQPDVQLPAGCLAAQVMQRSALRARRCNLDHGCCLNYERCVSCCLAPQHNASQLVPTAFRATDRWGQPPACICVLQRTCHHTPSVKRQVHHEALAAALSVHSWGCLSDAGASA